MTAGTARQIMHLLNAVFCLCMHCSSSSRVCDGPSGAQPTSTDQTQALSYHSLAARLRPSAVLRPSHMLSLITARKPCPFIVHSSTSASAARRPQWPLHSSDTNRRLVLRRARTESGDMELGTTAPEFEVAFRPAARLACTTPRHLHACLPRAGASHCRQSPT